ncbi:MAG: hypothetical protein A2745_03050 [Candidatus Harrisonbacteria bacterium RIFCSPHIGHO2_01_FULL_44_13]|uniref:Uncharacterized protein n=1 Tax=Candidatus Harrisonbacteria bacterium RIFCSPLOWO2_01_FULL_44_18 TaxID=1798407 RepID=A0A1G1ZMY1_9BACT|nr:MAG: hypothetical protein A2745_03050 [Candidatus Harrisonbacteria bacterium RIFCSPHIGHO2_01_FULL_44_13]OGY65759.1 MAG: hypothetical protein A3A16_04075 [Candidatus Harrisonbacteria bacterium RIFCSPLOWO2_01_FULL_44_18]
MPGKQKTATAIDDLARMVAEGFAHTVTKDELKNFAQAVETRLGAMETNLLELSAGIKEFVNIVKKQEAEVVDLRVKYRELENRVAKLESRKVK